MSCLKAKAREEIFEEKERIAIGIVKAKILAIEKQKRDVKKEKEVLIILEKELEMLNSKSVSEIYEEKVEEGWAY